MNDNEQGPVVSLNPYVDHANDQTGKEQEALATEEAAA